MQRPYDTSFARVATWRSTRFHESWSIDTCRGDWDTAAHLIDQFGRRYVIRATRSVSNQHRCARQTAGMTNSSLNVADKSSEWGANRATPGVCPPLGRDYPVNALWKLSSPNGKLFTEPWCKSMSLLW